MARAALSDIRLRDGNRCSWCGRGDMFLHVHHRKLRSQGGTSSASNLITLCQQDHDFMHRNRDYARTVGYILHAGDDPLTTPLSHALWAEASVLLTDDLCFMVQAPPPDGLIARPRLP